MPQSTFSQDLNQERIMSRYLDNHLYNSGVFEKCQRTDNMDEQDGGCDIVLTSSFWNIHECKVDEKAQLTYFNKDQATFAFELFYQKESSNGQYETRVGWFLNENKINEAYLLVWPFSNSSAKSGKIDNLRYEDIAGIRYLIVKKNKLIKYLENKGLTRERLLKSAQYYFKQRQSLLGERMYPREYDKDVYYTRSDNLNEKPVNLVIKRDILWILADMRGDVLGNTSEGSLKPYW